MTLGLNCGRKSVSPEARREERRERRTKGVWALRECSSRSNRRVRRIQKGAVKGDGKLESQYSR